MYSLNLSVPLTSMGHILGHVHTRQVDAIVWHRCHLRVQSLTTCERNGRLHTCAHHVYVSYVHYSAQNGHFTTKMGVAKLVQYRTIGIVGQPSLNYAGENTVISIFVRNK